MRFTHNGSRSSRLVRARGRRILIPNMSDNQHIAHTIAVAVTAGRITENEVVARASRALGKGWRWLRPLARRIEKQFADRTRPRVSAVRRWIEADAGFRRACQQHTVQASGELNVDPEMCVPSGPTAAGVLPPITTLDQLAEWVDLPIAELEWLADRGGQEASTPPKYRRYWYRMLSKGTRRFRLIESPIYRLKLLQRQLLSGVLNYIEPHAAAHGFRIGRSIHTFAARHTGRDVVLKMDLQDYFATIDFGRVSHLFRRVGYPERVADMLAAITTNTIPNEVRESASHVHGVGAGQCLPYYYARPHLPQGSPTSPAIANLVFYKLDLRLTGLANACGATYSRYADDLAFSGDAEFARRVNRVRHHIAAIVQDEGFFVNHHKTRVMRASTRQRIAGIVVNQHRNLARREYEQLKAILHNCRQHGLESQNRDGHPDFRAHLTGRVAFLESVHPAHGRRLREVLRQLEP